MLLHYTFTPIHLLACIYTSTWLNKNIIRTFPPYHFVRAFNNNLKKECCWTSHYNPDITKSWLGPPFKAPHSSNEAFVCWHHQEACYKKLFVFVCVCVLESVSCGVTKLQKYNARFPFLLLILENKAMKRWREKKKIKLMLQIFHKIIIPKLVPMMKRENIFCFIDDFV
jgi:hypothetical protein